MIKKISEKHIKNTFNEDVDFKSCQANASSYQCAELFVTLDKNGVIYKYK